MILNRHISELSHISHCVAAHFGARPKGYVKKIEKYIKLQEYMENRVNILDLYLTTYQNTKGDSYTYNSNNSSTFAITEHNYSILPQNYSSNSIYQGLTATSLRDKCCFHISNLDHAFYLGQELTKAETLIVIIFSIIGIITILNQLMMSIK